MDASCKRLYFGLGLEKISPIEAYYQKRRFVVYNAILKRLLENNKKAKWLILDLGSGQGAVLDIVKSHSPKSFTVGIDLSRPFCRLLKQKGHNPIIADVENPPIKSNVADCILLCEIIEHLRTLEKVLSEARRISLPSSNLLISTPNRWGIYEYKELVYIGYKPYELINSILNRPRSYYPFHIHIYQIKNLIKTLETLDFSIYFWTSSGFCLPFLGNIYYLGIKVSFNIFGYKPFRKLIEHLEKILWVVNWTLIILCVRKNEGSTSYT